MMKGRWYKAQLLAGILGVLVVALGLGACFVFGLLPILDLVDESRAIGNAVLGFGAGMLLWLNALRVIWQDELQYMRRETRVYDWQSGDWVAPE